MVLSLGRAVHVIADPDSSAMSKGVNSELKGGEINRSGYNKGKGLQGASVYRDFTIQPYGAFFLYQMLFFHAVNVAYNHRDSAWDLPQEFSKVQYLFLLKEFIQKKQRLEVKLFSPAKEYVYTLRIHSIYCIYTVLYILLIWCFLLWSTVKATNTHRTWGKCSPDPILQYSYIQLCRNSSLPPFVIGSLLKYFHFYCSLSHLIYLFIYYFVNLEDLTASGEYMELTELEVIIF